MNKEKFKIFNSLLYEEYNKLPIQEINFLKSIFIFTKSLHGYKIYFLIDGVLAESVEVKSQAYYEMYLHPRVDIAKKLLNIIAMLNITI